MTYSASQRPEIVIGIVAAVGTPIEEAIRYLKAALDKVGYNAVTIHLSEYSDHFELPLQKVGAAKNAFERLERAMKRGTRTREVTGHDDILAIAAIVDIHIGRKDSTFNSQKSPTAYVLRQLKHPAEVHVLRETYDDRFFLLGFYMPPSERIRILREKIGVPEEKMEELISRDDYEGTESGQRFRDTFHLSDAFIGIGKKDNCLAELDRLFSLIFGTEIVTPRREEFGMFQAFGAALRSSQLSRQVGAAILSDLGDVIAVGTNEVPQAGGGSYWEGNLADERDHKIGFDSNDQMKVELVNEIVQKFQDENLLDESKSEENSIKKFALKALESSRVDALIEFGRAVHAEADALASAARLGKPSLGADLFCTTFPCHLCAKHIISSGIRMVTFIEPYPKSLAEKLHGDAISLEEGKIDKVLFQAFIGVAPRRYAQLFSAVDYTGRQIERKDAEGRVKENLSHVRLRMTEEDTLLREIYVFEKLKQLSEENGETGESLMRIPIGNLGSETEPETEKSNLGSNSANGGNVIRENS